MLMIDSQLPESCDDGGKRPKSDLESESEHESDSDSEPELVSIPPSVWNTKPIEDLEISDFSSVYDNDPYPFYFAGPRFVYQNAAYIKREEENKKAMDEYYEISRNLTPFDGIPLPDAAMMRCGSNFPRPFYIEESERPLLFGLSKLALDYYNAHNQDTNYVFDELVKAVYRPYPLVTYYITFKAKNVVHHHPSDSLSTTFQAHVWQKRSVQGPPEVKSCSIKA